LRLLVNIAQRIDTFKSTGRSPRLNPLSPSSTPQQSDRDVEIMMQFAPEIKGTAENFSAVLDVQVFLLASMGLLGIAAKTFGALNSRICGQFSCAIAVGSYKRQFSYK